MSNMSDLVDHCRRITRMADVSLMVDGEDGFGNAVNVVRTVRELEAAGVAAIEIEDNIAPVRFNGGDRGLVSQAEQVGKLEAAVAARTIPLLSSSPALPPWPIVRWTRPWTGSGIRPDGGGGHTAGGPAHPPDLRRCTRQRRSPDRVKPAGRHQKRCGVPCRPWGKNPHAGQSCLWRGRQSHL